MSFKTAKRRLNSEGVPPWRKDSANLFGQSLSRLDHEVFKNQDHSKPQARRWDGIFSQEATKRKPSSIKAASRTADQPGMISLGAGKPSSAYFPFDEVNVKISDAAGSKSMMSMAAYDFQPGVNDYGLDVALNYDQGTGSAQMLQFVHEHTEVIHDPPYSDWGCCLTVGSTSAWDAAPRMFCEKGDYIIMEQYIYSSALETAWPFGVKALSVAMDDQGLIPDALEHHLTNWNEVERQARRPFLLYMVPTGHNPTGSTQSIERRKAIYRLAQKFDLFIVEDETYYYLQLGQFHPEKSNDEASQGSELVPSYLSLDVDGRVLRLNSLSKVLAPGCRLGWVTAPHQVIEKLVRQNETSSQSPSGFSQVVVHKLLKHHWEHLGFFEWLKHMQAEYRWRRNTFAEVCAEVLPPKIARWTVPRAGMFQWIEIDWKSHPAYKTDADHAKIQQAILASAVELKVFLTPGTCFWSDVGTTEERMFFRATYASASLEELKEAVRRFAAALRIEFDCSLGLRRPETPTISTPKDKAFSVVHAKTEVDRQ